MNVFQQEIIKDRIKSLGVLKKRGNIYGTCNNEGNV